MRAARIKSNLQMSSQIRCQKGNSWTVMYWRGFKVQVHPEPEGSGLRRFEARGLSSSPLRQMAEVRLSHIYISLIIFDYPILTHIFLYLTEIHGITEFTEIIRGPSQWKPSRRWVQAHRGQTRSYRPWKRWPLTQQMACWTAWLWLL